MGLAWPFLAQVRVETKYSGYRLFGLTTSDIGGGFCPTRYGLELVHGGALEIYENCLRVAYPPALVYGAGDQLRIEADAGVVRYKRQVAGAGTWEVLYTSTLPVTAALYFNASLYTPGSTLKEIRFVSGSTGAPSVNRTYYTFGGARVAMRDGAGAALVYLHGDQLGSASLATSMTGTVLSQQRYKPYGEVRWTSGGGMPTDRQFTSQTRSSYGTIFMSAREYLPSLGRFLSADSIVPGAGNPQALNRYAYVFNSPLSFVDPSGHDPAGSQNNCNYSGQGCGGAGSQTDIETQHIILAGTQWWYDRQSAQSCADHPVECAAKKVVDSVFMVLPIGLVGVTVLPTFLTSYAVTKATVAGVAAAETVVAVCGGECSEEIETAGRVARTFQTFGTGLGQTRETILSGGRGLYSTQVMPSSGPMWEAIFAGWD